MGNTLYLECQTGISGDMTVAALLDLGADESALMKALKSLPLSGYRVEITRKKVSSLDVCDFNVILDEENHDHDMEYLYGHEHHHHGEEAGDHHHHGEKHVHHHEKAGHHHHRGMREIRAIIEAADLTSGAKSLALKIFEIIARAEAKAHATTVEEVHFHEVGAVDSIVDVVAAAVCLDNLNITEGIVTEVSEGTGMVRCAHGFLPVPVPAVLNIMGESGIVLKRVERTGELVTPTGAAILAAVMTKSTLPKRYRITASGMGAGKRAYEIPSILRAMLIEDLSKAERVGVSEEDYIWKLETNVDDCGGEALGFCMEELFAAGAKDVYYSPVYMKKNRPGYELNVLCDEERRAALERIIFAHTTTIGIRRTKYKRTILSRKESVRDTAFGPIHVKEVTLPDGSKRSYPEYEDVARIARERGCAFHEVLEEIKTF